MWNLCPSVLWIRQQDVCGTCVPVYCGSDSRMYVELVSQCTVTGSDSRMYVELVSQCTEDQTAGCMWNLCPSVAAHSTSLSAAKASSNRGYSVSPCLYISARLPVCSSVYIFHCLSCMTMCEGVCVCVRMCVCVCARARACVCVCMYACARMCSCACVRACPRVDAHSRTRLCICLSVSVLLCACMSLYI